MATAAATPETEPKNEEEIPSLRLKFQAFVTTACFLLLAILYVIFSPHDVVTSTSSTAYTTLRPKTSVGLTCLANGGEPSGGDIIFPKLCQRIVIQLELDESGNLQKLPYMWEFLANDNVDLLYKGLSFNDMERKIDNLKRIKGNVKWEHKNQALMDVTFSEIFEDSVVETFLNVIATCEKCLVTIEDIHNIPSGDVVQHGKMGRMEMVVVKRRATEVSCKSNFPWNNGNTLKFANFLNKHLSIPVAISTTSKIVKLQRMKERTKTCSTVLLSGDEPILQGCNLTSTDPGGNVKCRGEYITFETNSSLQEMADHAKSHGLNCALFEADFEETIGSMVKRSVEYLQNGPVSSPRSPGMETPAALEIWQL